MLNSCLSSKEISNKIIWSTSNLKWSNFKGNPQASNYAASINSNIELKQLDSNKYAIVALMDMGSSWHKQKPDECLLHEQYHFNITEIFARKLRQEVKEKNLNINSIDFRKTFLSSLMALAVEQKKYDEQTNHSINKDKQIEWQKNIDKQLLNLGAYESIYLD